MSIETMVNKVIDEWEKRHRIIKFGSWWRNKLIKEIHQELIRMTTQQPCYDNSEETKIAKYLESGWPKMHRTLKGAS